MKRRHDIQIPSETTHSGVSRRALLVGTPAAAAVLTASGCIGSFPATNKLLAWNMEIGSKWVNWLVFLAFMIIPVYPIVWGIVDLWVMNSIEFWTGDSPVSSKDLPDGGRLVTARVEGTPNTARMTHENADGQIVAMFYVEKVSDQEFRMVDEHGELLLHASGKDSATLRDAQGRRIAKLSPRQLRKVAKAAQERRSTGEAVWNELGENGQQGPILAVADGLRESARI